MRGRIASIASRFRGSAEYESITTSESSTSTMSEDISQRSDNMSAFSTDSRGSILTSTPAMSENNSNHLDDASTNTRGSVPFGRKRAPCSIYPIPSGDLGTEMVDIYVGQNKQHFRLHRKRLCEHVKAFESMFSRESGFQESQSNIATLPEDDAAVFNLFVGWLYSGSIPAASGTKSELTFEDKKAATTLRVHLYCFAEKYLIMDLLDLTMDTIMRMYDAAECLPDEEQIDYVFTNTSERSKLRLFMARALHHIICHQSEPISEDTKEGWRSEDLAEVLCKHPDMCTDLIRLSRVPPDIEENPHQIREFPSPLDPKQRRCTYHVHSRRESVKKCPDKHDKWAFF